ncbi:MAG: hypothetical protein JWQ79_1477, partial [Mucilaginibacter sp.]|nr:hypothetical protein [Mucilaginibacter sp.]
FTDNEVIKLQYLISVDVFIVELLKWKLNI